MTTPLLRTSEVLVDRLLCTSTRTFQDMSRGSARGDQTETG